MLSDAEKNRRRKSNRERDQKVVDLYTSGKDISMKEVGERLGLSKQLVSYICKKYGVEGKWVRESHRRKKRKDIICENCEKEFTVARWKSDRTFCSRSCANEAMSYDKETLKKELIHLQEKHGKITSTLIKEEAEIAYNTFRKHVGDMNAIRNLIRNSKEDV